MISLTTFIYVNIAYISVYSFYSLFQNNRHKKNKTLMEKALAENKTLSVQNKKSNKQIKHYKQILSNAGGMEKFKNKYYDLKETCNGIIVKYNENVKEQDLLVLYNTELYEKTETQIDTILNLEADMFFKNEEIKKLETRVEILEKECMERKYEVLKLRKTKKHE